MNRRENREGVTWLSNPDLHRDCDSCFSWSYIAILYRLKWCVLQPVSMGLFIADHVRRAFTDFLDPVDGLPDPVVQRKLTT